MPDRTRAALWRGMPVLATIKTKLAKVGHIAKETKAKDDDDRRRSDCGDARRSIDATPQMDVYPVANA